MGQPVLSAKITADDGQFTKKLAELEAQLKRFQAGMKTAGNTESFARLSRAAEEAQRRIAALKNLGNPLTPIKGGADSATQSLINLGRVAQDAPFGFMGIANNLNPLFEGFGRLSKESGGAKGALKELGKSLGGAGGISLAVSLASSLLVVFGDRLFKTSKETDKAAESAKKLKEATDSIFANAGKEAAEAAGLVGVLKNETETRERKILALKELQRIQPEIFGQLKLEGDAVAGLDAAYTKYLENLRTVIAVKIKQAQLEAKISDLLQKEGQTRTKSEKQFADAGKKAIDEINKVLTNPTGRPEDTNLDFKSFIEKQADDSKKELNTLKTDIEALFKDITELSKGVDLKGGLDKGKDPLDEIIKRAKELAEFFDKTTIRDIKFEVNPTLSKKENALRAGDFIKQVLDPIRRTEFQVKPEINVRPEFRLDLQKIELFKNRSENTKEATKTFDQVEKEFTDQLTKLGANNQFVLQLNANVKISQDFEKRLADAAAQLNTAATSFLGNAFESIGNDIEGVLSGKNFGEGLIDAMSSFIINIGKALIQFGIIKSSLDKLLKVGLGKLSGVAAIGLGIAAIAIGNLIKNSSKNIAGFRAAGGPVSGGRSYVVGEKGPEIFVPNTGGSIIPNHKLGSGAMAGITGGQSIQVTGQFELAGNKLVAFITNTLRSQGRLT